MTNISEIKCPFCDNHISMTDIKHYDHDSYKIFACCKPHEDFSIFTDLSDNITGIKIQLIAESKQYYITNDMIAECLCFKDKFEYPHFYKGEYFKIDYKKKLLPQYYKLLNKILKFQVFS